MELETVRMLSRTALQNLEAHRKRIDDLNVYPVPDGDTGTNLVLTLRSIVEALDASTAEASAAVAKDLSRAALMGARGNSGVIFSQIARGFADVLGGSDDMSTPRLARAFRAASDAARSPAASVSSNGRRRSNSATASVIGRPTPCTAADAWGPCSAWSSAALG